MSPELTKVVSDNDSFPRVSGDEPKGIPSLMVGKWFSPRERG